MDEVGCPEPARVVQRMLSTAICAARSFHSWIRSSMGPLVGRGRAGSAKRTALRSDPRSRRRRLPHVEPSTGPAAAENGYARWRMTTHDPSFEALGVSDAVIETLAARGIHAPFPIQQMVIEDATEGRDTLAKSKTGSGKTLGFAIPIVEQLDPDATSRPLALVLVPTRELATQVKEDFTDIAKAKHLRVKAVYGGTQREGAGQGVEQAHILIATPGRLDDLVERRWSSSRRADLRTRRSRPHARHGVPAAGRPHRAPSAERSADDVLLGDARRRGGPDRRGLHPQPGPSRDRVRVARRSMRPTTASSRSTAPPSCRPLIELAHEEEQTGLTLVFVNTKRRVESLARQLRHEGVPTVTMHGDMTQQARERALQRFEDKHVGVLIATDVAARGLDLDDITLVVNYDPPQDDKGYVHRVGRTARAGRAGMSVTFVTPDQLGDVSRMAARLDLHEEFEQEGMKVAPPRHGVQRRARGARASRGLRAARRRR